MAEIIVLTIIILWLFGVIRIPFVNIPGIPITFPPFINQPLIIINNRPISLENLIVFIIISAIIGILPSPIREIIALIWILYLLTFLGFIAFGGVF